MKFVYGWKFLNCIYSFGVSLSSPLPFLYDNMKLIPILLCPQRLIPVDASNDLFVYKTPEVPLNHAYVIRPYLPEDHAKLYSLILRTSDDGRDGTALYAAHTDLPGDL